MSPLRRSLHADCTLPIGLSTNENGHHCTHCTLTALTAHAVSPNLDPITASLHTPFRVCSECSDGERGAGQALIGRSR